MILCEEKITLKTVDETDILLLQKWWNDGKVMSHAGFPHGLGITKEQIKTKLYQLNSNYQILLLSYNKKPIGEMNYRAVTHDGCEIGIKICDFHYQERGIGTKAIELLVDYLFEIGFKKVMLDTNKENKRAIHVYSKIGFKITDTKIDHWVNQVGIPQSVVYMELLFEDWIKKTDQ